jgi:hypothetical protein
MFKAKGFAVFILFLGSHFCLAQYDGLNGDENNASRDRATEQNRKPSDDTLIDDYEEKKSLMDKAELYKGLEFMTNGSQNFLYLCFDPQAGISFNDRLILGGGMNVGLNNLSGMAGLFGFSRIVLNQIFLQAEYRTINTYVTDQSKRDWVSSPIFLVGYAYNREMSSWASIGLSINGDYSRNMPFGALVYRFGIRF